MIANCFIKIINKKDLSGAYPSRIQHSLIDIEQGALHRFVAHSADRGKESMCISLKVTPKCVDVSSALLSCSAHCAAAWPSAAISPAFSVVEASSASISC